MRSTLWILSQLAAECRTTHIVRHALSLNSLDIIVIVALLWGVKYGGLRIPI